MTPLEDYICWLSDDDLLLPNYIADLAGYLDTHPEAECVYGGSRHVKIHPSLGEQFIRNLPEESPFPVFSASYTPGWRIDGGQFMIRRSALERVPYPYYPEDPDPSVARVCDALFMDKIARYMTMYPVQVFIMTNRMTSLGSHVAIDTLGRAQVKDWRIKLICDVTAVIVSLNTYELTRRAADSLVRFYPSIPLIMVDNGSIDQTPAYIQACGVARKETECVFLPQNVGHGPALHMAAEKATTPYLFTLDSDCVVEEGGFLELMVECFRDESVYAVGDLLYVRSSDCLMDTREPLAWPEFTPYICPYMGLYRLSMYKQIRPFVHHGGPALFNMVDARERNWKCVSFPVRDYISHLGGGTWSLYGQDWNVVPGRRPNGW